MVPPAMEISICPFHKCKNDVTKDVNFYIPIIIIQFRRHSFRLLFYPPGFFSVNTLMPDFPTCLSFLFFQAFSFKYKTARKH